MIFMFSVGCKCLNLEYFHPLVNKQPSKLGTENLLLLFPKLYKLYDVLWYAVQKLIELHIKPYGTSDPQEEILVDSVKESVPHEDASIFYCFPSSLMTCGIVLYLKYTYHQPQVKMLTNIGLMAQSHICCDESGKHCFSLSSHSLLQGVVITIRGAGSPESSASAVTHPRCPAVWPSSKLSPAGWLGQGKRHCGCDSCSSMQRGPLLPQHDPSSPLASKSRAKSCGSSKVALLHTYTYGSNPIVLHHFWPAWRLAQFDFSSNFSQFCICFSENCCPMTFL